MSRAPDTLRGVMTGDVVTVTPGDSIATAIRAMIDRDIGSVVVVEDGSSVGVFTERDITRRVLDDRELVSRPLAEVMSTPVVAAGPDTDVVAAFELMNRRGIRRLPVVERGHLVGIVTERDLLRWVGQVARE